MMFIDTIQRDYRRMLCYECPFLRKHFKLLGITFFKNRKQCSICKCDILSKTVLTNSKCPKGKWS